MGLSQRFNELSQAFQAEPFPSSAQRKQVLQQLKKVLQDQAYEIAEAVSQDFSYRAEEETLFLEIFPTIKAIRYGLKHLKKWMKRRKRKVSWMFFPASAFLAPQPLGVVGIMVPWNYPVYLALVPALYALAAGNKVMIKMSELSPHTGALLEKLFKAKGLDSHLMVINGDVEVAKSFAALPFGHLLFTGSTSVGRLVMKAASEHLTPVTLELGGKSPAILSSTMNKRYFKRLFMGKLFNAAQTCVAPDYLLVPSGWETVVLEAFKHFIATHYPAMTHNGHYSSIISEAHQQRLLSLIDDAKNKGATVEPFGEISSDHHKMPFYLLFHVTPEMQVMKEEIFGPILPVLTYPNMDKAIEWVNSYPNPLALYYFGEDSSEKKQIETHTLSGALTINDTLMHIALDDLPFGGVGLSGMGQYHGQEGFDAFSKLKPVMVQKWFSSVTLMYPPYGVMLRCLLRIIGGIKPKNTLK